MSRFILKKLTQTKVSENQPSLFIYSTPIHRIKQSKKEYFGKDIKTVLACDLFWVEIVPLVDPGFNDSEAELRDIC